MELTEQLTPIHGICVLNRSQLQQNNVTRLAKATLEHLNHASDSTANIREKVITNDNYLGEGYGISNTATIKQCAELEGLLLDPVYTGKAMSGLIGMCNKGEFTQNSNILFIHTGGGMGLFAYAEEF